jgi:Cu-Zn family superoxide dismutase
VKRNFLLSLPFVATICCVLPLGNASGQAIAVLHPASNSQVKGVVMFLKTPDGVLVDAHVTGPTPGNHGFHIHELGNCSAPDATTACVTLT